MLMQFIKLWWKPFSLVIIWWEYVIDVSFTRCCYLYLIVPTYARLLGVLEHPELGWPKHQPVIMVQLNLHIGKRDSQAKYQPGIMVQLTELNLHTHKRDSQAKYQPVVMVQLNLHIGKRDSQAIICKITLKCLFPLQIDSSRWTKYLTIIRV